MVGQSAGNEIWAEEGGGNKRQEEIAGALSVCVKWPEREADNSHVYIVDIQNAGTHNWYAIVWWCLGEVMWWCASGLQEVTACYARSLVSKIIKPSGHYMHRQFNIQQFHVLPTQCIYMFCVDLRTNNDYSPTQH